MEPDEEKVPIGHELLVAVGVEVDMPDWELVGEVDGCADGDVAALCEPDAVADDVNVDVTDAVASVVVVTVAVALFVALAVAVADVVVEVVADAEADDVAVAVATCAQLTGPERAHDPSADCE